MKNFTPSHYFAMVLLTQEKLLYDNFYLIFFPNKYNIVANIVIPVKVWEPVRELVLQE
ncbi:MAG: hypothetical protein NTX22_06190 [Ignavibacteriales bacterium]|nr:hypothetical protein [Ignavibacteriales bacterium]